MIHAIRPRAIFGRCGFGAVLVSGVTLLGGATMGLAKDSAGRERHYGVIETRPEGRLGTWVIGQRSFVADSRTEFDETEGPLALGSCAKVDIRNGRVHEIDSEPLSDCR